MIIMKNKVLLNLFIVGVIVAVWAGLHIFGPASVQTIKVYPNFDANNKFYTDEDRAKIAAMPIQAGDSVKVDWKAYQKKLPNRGDMIVYYSMLENDNNGHAYSIGRVIAFPNEEVDVEYGPDNLPNVNEVRAGSSNRSDFLAEYPTGSGKATLCTPNNTVNNHLRFVVLNIFSSYRKPWYDSLDLPYVYGKLLAVTAPPERKRKIE